MWIHEIYSTLSGVFSVHNNHRQAPDNPNDIRECAYHICFSAPLMWQALRGLYILFDRLSAKKIWVFYWKCSTGATWICSHSCAAGFIISLR